uniref:Ig-like domain-containing protein n=1 Tax=Denticeps clupeoides TaxID=299321 RepID=A0AAY4ADR1_9TELE
TGVSLLVVCLGRFVWHQHWSNTACTKSPLKIRCSITGVSNPYVYWYVWTPADGLKLIFTSVVVGEMDPADQDGFKASRLVDRETVLESAGVEPAAPSVWYCAASSHSNRVKSGCCTKTTKYHSVELNL